MVIPDSTIAWDTLAFALYRIAHCILCGRAVPVELAEAQRCRACGQEATPWGSVWACTDADTGRQMSCAFVVCHLHACRQPHHEVETAVDQKLRQRYGFSEHEGTAPQTTQG